MVAEASAYGRVAPWLAMEVVAGPPLEPGQPLVRRLMSDATGSWEWRPKPGDPLAARSLDDVRADIKALAAGLIDAGVEPGDRVALRCSTRPEWLVLDAAIQAVGGITAGHYPTWTPELCQAANDSTKPRMVIVEDDAMAAQTPADIIIDSGLDSLRAAPSDEVEARLEAIHTDTPASLVFTSGTTGDPKGATLTHGNWAAAVDGAIIAMGVQHVRDPSFVAFLPLSHVAGYVGTQAVVHLGGRVVFGRPKTMLQDLQDTRPTLMGGVPRIFERMIAGIRQKAAEAGGAKHLIFQRAEKVAEDYGRARNAGGRAPLLLDLRHSFYEQLVYKPLRQRIGFDRLEAALTGAAPVRPELLHLLQGLGFHIVEGYGLTESAALVTCNAHDHYRTGTAGTPIPGATVAVDEHGEVLARGPMIFAGYWNNPEATAATFVQRDGHTWLRTGDMGRWDNDHLVLVDRIKEIEVLDTGKNIVPLRVEEALRAQPLIADAVITGHGRPAVAALIQPDYDALAAWATQNGAGNPKLVYAEGPLGRMTVGADAAFLNQDAVRAQFQAAIDDANGELADYERVRRFHLLERAFSAESGELTPTLKKKRRVIQANQAAAIDALYA